MARDVNETLDGGFVRDEFNRRVYVLADKHTTPATTDLPANGTLTDADGREQIVIQSGNTGQSLLSVESRSVFKDTDSEIDGRLGIGVAVSANARIKIGPGTGSLTDAPDMGLKIRIDSDVATSPDGQQVNVNIVQGTGAGAVHGSVSRIDVNDASANTGDTVALWGDVFVRAASARPVWAQNAYVQIVSGVAYTAAAIGAELGVFNDGTTDNTGGVLHLVSRGAKKVQFGLLIGEAAGNTNQIKHGILIKDSTLGPASNAIYFGATDGSNEPTGNPRFAVSATGDVQAGGSIAAGATGVFRVRASGDTADRVTLNADGSISLGNGSSAPVVALRRPGSNQVGTGTNQSFILGTGTSGGTVFLQGFEQTADPAAPPADGWRLYGKDNGSGKTQVGVLFSTGAFVPFVTQA